MIAKLVTYGATRPEAAKRMATALDAFAIRGVNHNIGFLSAIIRKARFLEGRLSTDFIPAEFPDGFHGTELPQDELDLLVTIAAVAHRRTIERDRHGVHVASEWTVLVGPPPREARAVEVTADGAGSVTVALDGQIRVVNTAWQPGQVLFEGVVDGAPVTVQLDRKGVTLQLHRAGAVIDMRVVTRATGELTALMPVKIPPDMSKFLLSPMPGLLVSVAVTEGQAVKAGEELAVVEAMKMENVLRAERDGTVGKIAAQAGQSLSVDQVILEFE